MRLLITVPWAERLGGAETMLYSFLRSIDSQRVEIHVVFFARGGFVDEVAALPGITASVVDVGRIREVHRTAVAIARLARLMRRQRFDIVLNWSASAQIYAGSAALLAGLSNRVVWWQHAIPSGHRMERAATLVPARAVGCSSTAAARAQNAMLPRRATFVVNPGTGPRRAEAIDRSAARIPDGRFVVGIVGRLQPWKGQHRVLEAVAELRARGRDVHALIVGGDAHALSPEYGPALERLVDRLGLGDRVTMTGHVRDPLPYVGVMDVLVNVSVAEPFGIVLIEAMSQTVPVVAVADGGATDIVEPEVSGLLIARPDATLLADALDRLAVDSALRERISHAGYARALEYFTETAMATRLTEALEGIASEPRRRRLDRSLAKAPAPIA